MKDFNLPIIKGEGTFDKNFLSMDDYLKFVQLNLKYVVNMEESRKWKKKLAVNFPFSLK